MVIDSNAYILIPNTPWLSRVFGLVL